MTQTNHAVVTGGAGFLGAHLCTSLVARGWQVTCIDNLLTGSVDNVAHLLDEPRFSMVESDVTEPIPVAGPVQLVLHFASPASPVHYLRHPIETLSVGSAGTRCALELAEDRGARFVLASTSEVYGDPLVHPQPEQYWGNVNPVGPRAVYDEAKRFAEAMTTAFRCTRGVDTAIVRIFNTYGPGMRADDGRAIPTFVRQALANEPVTVAGDGTQTRSLCYVDDVIDGILAVADSDLTGPVNIGNPHEMAVRDIAARVIAATESSSRIEFVGAACNDPRRRKPDTSLIESRLGWRPTVDWDTGIARTIEWFRSAADTRGKWAVGAVAGAAR